MKYLVCFCSLLIFASCSKKASEIGLKNHAPDSQIAKVYTQLAGYYRSGENPGLDSTYQNLEFHLIPFSPMEDDDALWLYAERFSKTNPNARKSQFVYKLIVLDDMTGLERYSVAKIKNQISYDNLDVLRKTDASSLRKERGCTIFFRENSPGVFIGTTLLSNCKNRFRGAMFSRVEIKSTEDQIIFLEQGFDEYNKFMWGTKKKGINFKKQG